MLIHLKGGRIIDPVSGRDEIGDLWIENDRIVAPPHSGVADEVYDVSGKIVMAGAIDIHSHIAGGNENIARLLLPELHQTRVPHPFSLPLSTAKWSTFETGCRYASMGFTTVIEPAVPPHHALQAHLELSDIPIIDKGTLTVLGNDDFLLSLLREMKARPPSPTTLAPRLWRAMGLASNASMPAARPHSNITSGPLALTMLFLSMASRRAGSSRLCSKV